MNDELEQTYQACRAAQFAYESAVEENKLATKKVSEASEVASEKMHEFGLLVFAKAEEAKILGHKCPQSDIVHFTRSGRLFSVVRTWRASQPAGNYDPRFETREVFGFIDLSRKAQADDVNEEKQSS